MVSTPDRRATRRALLASAALVAPASLLPAIAAAASDNGYQMPTDPHPAEAAATPAVLLAHALLLHDILDVPGMAETDLTRTLVEALVAGLRSLDRLDGEVLTEAREART